MNSSITLDIQANLDSLTKSIKAVNKSMKLDLGLNIKNALKEATKGLKEGLAQNKPIAELNELRNKIKEATSVQLKLKLDNATNQLKNLVPQALATYATFKGLISKPIGASLDFNNAINQINAFTNFSSQELESFKQDIWDLGKNNGISIDNILKTSELSAQLGVSKNDLKDFSQLALNMQVGLKLSSEESVNSISQISKAFNLDTSKLQTLTDEITQMGLSTKTSAKKILEVTKATASGAKAFRLSARDTSALSASFLSVGLDSSEASSSINKFFTELNNIDNATEGFKRSLAKMGIDSQQLKEDIKTNPQEAIKNLFEDLNDLDDEERFGVISELFGKKMANNINSAKDGVKAFEKALEASKDSAGALQKAVDRVAGDGFGDLVVSLGSAFKHLAVSIGNGFVPILKPIFKGIKKIVEVISGLLDSHKWVGIGIAFTSMGIILIKSIGLIAVAFKHLRTIVFYPLQLAITKLKFSMFSLNATTKTTSITNSLFGNSLRRLKIQYYLLNKSIKRTTKQTYSFLASLLTGKINIFAKSLKILKIGFISFGSIFKGLILGIRAFSVALLTSPIGWIGLAIASVAIVVYKFWKPIQAFFIGVFEGIKQSLSPLIEVFQVLWNSIRSVFAPVGKLIMKIFSALGLQINSTGEELEGFTQTGVAVGNALGSIIKVIAYPFSLFIKIITLIFETISKLINYLSNTAFGKWLSSKLGIDVSQNMKVENSNIGNELKGVNDEIISKQQEYKQSLVSSKSDNSKQINDYKTITINTGSNPQAVAQAINTNSYSFEDDEF